MHDDMFAPSDKAAPSCRLAGAAARRFLERGPDARGGRGKIFNDASALSFQDGIIVPAYAAAKHGAAGLTRALAKKGRLQVSTSTLSRRVAFR
jgi:NAD(P)-dependent dehydrogenase (short-subunit alcohol dehydrogenase family)